MLSSPMGQREGSKNALRKCGSSSSSLTLVINHGARNGAPIVSATFCAASIPSLLEEFHGVARKGKGRAIVAAAGLVKRRDKSLHTSVWCFIRIGKRGNREKERRSYFFLESEAGLKKILREPRCLDHGFFRSNVDTVRSRQGVYKCQVAHGWEILDAKFRCNNPGTEAGKAVIVVLPPHLLRRDSVI